jgi:hypothetical protein
MPNNKLKQIDIFEKQGKLYRIKNDISKALTFF